MGNVVDSVKAPLPMGSASAPWQALVEAMPDRVWLKSPEGLYLACNPAFERFYGFGAQHALGRTDAELFDAETAGRHRATDQAAQESAQPLRWESEHAAADGTPGIFETIKTRVSAADGQLVGVLGVARDITLRKQLEMQQQDANASLQTTLQALQVTLDSMSQGISQFDAAGRHTLYNRRLLELLELPEDMLAAGPTIFEVMRFQTERGDFCVHGEFADPGMEKFFHSGGQAAGVPEMYVRPMRSGRVVEVATRKLPDGALVRTFSDVTAYVRANDDLQAERRRLAQILEGTQAGTWEWALATGTLEINERWAGIAGYSLKELAPFSHGKLQQMQHPEDAQRATERWQAYIDGQADRFECDMRLRHKAGHWVWMLARGRVHSWAADGKPLLVAGTALDISDLKLAEDRLRHVAQHDPLTGLPNRALLADRLQRALASARRQRGQLALMFIDLDAFKPINDTLGHDVGDLLLKDIARRLSSCMRESDSVARIGGDEFVVLLPGVQHESDSVQVAEKLQRALSHPFLLAGHALTVSCSIGIALHPRDGEDAAALMAHADQAMYRAKHLGRNGVQVYRGDMPAG